MPEQKSQISSGRPFARRLRGPGLWPQRAGPPQSPDQAATCSRVRCPVSARAAPPTFSRRTTAQTTALNCRGEFLPAKHSSFCPRGPSAERQSRSHCNDCWGFRGSPGKCWSLHDSSWVATPAHLPESEIWKSGNDPRDLSPPGGEGRHRLDWCARPCATASFPPDRSLRLTGSHGANPASTLNPASAEEPTDLVIATGETPKRAASTIYRAANGWLSCNFPQTAGCRSC